MNAALQQIVSEKSDLVIVGCFIDRPVNEIDADMKSVYHYTLKLRGIVPGPHKIYLINPKLLRTIVPSSRPNRR
jgi:4-carboxymuconolactone decarboxylase